MQLVLSRYFNNYFKGRNFRGKKLSRFRGFQSNPRKFIPAKFFKRRHPRKFLPAKFSKKFVICEYSEKKYAFVVMISNYCGIRKISKIKNSRKKE